MVNDLTGHGIDALRVLKFTYGGLRVGSILNDGERRSSPARMACGQADEPTRTRT
jgi:hypothetical protein